MREGIGSISVKYKLKKIVRPDCNPKHFRSLICAWVVTMFASWHRT